MYNYPDAVEHVSPSNPDERSPSTTNNADDGNNGIKPRLKRMERDLFDMVRDPEEIILPSALKLRPLEAPGPSSSSLDATDSDKLSGNFISHIKTTEAIFNQCIREHLTEHTDCPGLVILDPERYVQMGLGLKAGLRCNLCSYKSIRMMKFYDEVEGPNKKKGPKPVKLNVQLQVALTKEPIGNSAMRNIFAALDISPPSERGMQTMSNRVSSVYKDINKDQLAKNRQLVEKVMTIRQERDGGETVNIAVEADGAYNNPPKGRAFSQPGTQSWVPMICAENGIEMPVGFATRSKLCSCRGAKKGQHRPGCGKTFPSHVAMGNSERDMGGDCARQVTSRTNLRIGTIIADGDGHLAKGVEESVGPVERQHCARHLTKSVARNIMKANLQCLPGPTQTLMAKQKRDLAQFIQKRCAWEYRVAHQKFKKNIRRLVTACEMIKRGIIACVEGDEDTCRRVSMVCKAHRRKGGKGKLGGVGENRVCITF